MNSDYYSMYDSYYGFRESRNRKNEVEERSGEIIPFYQAVELIRQSVGDEKEDEMFYDDLIRQAPTEKEKGIIRSIRDDERKHNQILRRLYYEFTGKTLPTDTFMNESNSNMDYRSNLEKALFGELDAVAKYRKILGNMPSGDPYTLVMSIMTDELRHASKYNFLIHNAQ